MKKKICLIVVIMLTFSLLVPATAIETVQLSSLSDDEIVEFLVDFGVDLPDVYTEGTSWMTFIRFVIEIVEEDPSTRFVFEDFNHQELACEIKVAVNAYYGVTETALTSNARTTATLQDSTVLGEWDDVYETYNCYGYAIGVYRRLSPGQLAWENSGAAGSFYYDWTQDVSVVAGWVKNDLESLGYDVCEPTTTMPETEVTAHVRLICIRTDTYGEAYYQSMDFHLMKLEEDGCWYHKPGGTIPLMYNYVPTTSRIWLGECWDEDGYNPNRLVSYTSDIYFIEYTIPYEYTYEYTDSSTHTRTCQYCGETTQETHTLSGGTYTGNNYHQRSLHYYQYTAACTVCGGTVTYWSGTLCMGPPCLVPDTGLTSCCEGELE